MLRLGIKMWNDVNKICISLCKPSAIIQLFGVLQQSWVSIVSMFPEITHLRKFSLKISESEKRLLSSQLTNYNMQNESRRRRRYRDTKFIDLSYHIFTLDTITTSQFLKTTFSKWAAVRKHRVSWIHKHNSVIQTFSQYVIACQRRKMCTLIM